MLEPIEQETPVTEPAELLAHHEAVGVQVPMLTLTSQHPRSAVRLVARGRFDQA